MTVTMYDSDTAADIPADAPAVAGYVDGAAADFHELEQTHAGKPVISITRTTPGIGNARVADAERGALTYAGAAEWARNEIELGRRPTIYYSKDFAGDVTAALKAAGVAVADVDYWVADWTGEPHEIEGAVAVQYASPTVPAVDGPTGHFDLSVADASWLVGSLAPASSSSSGAAGASQPTKGFAPMPPVLKVGDLSPAVRSAQALLALHSPLAVDGDFGPHTETAVRNFQTVMHLVVDGIVGPQTWGALCTFG